MKLSAAVLVTILLGIVFCLSLGAQAGGNAAGSLEKKDVYIILDVSGSMNKAAKFANVKLYVENDIFRNLLKIGDRLTLITFGNTAREDFSETIRDENTKAELLEKMKSLRANDDYTDIGTAMETLFGVLSRQKDTDLRQVILFITDGKHTPPKTSPYSGKDLAVDERFRDIGEKISKAGWFLYVIGIGEETDAKKIADSVASSVYRKTDENMKDVKVEEYIVKTDEVRTQRRVEDAASAAAAAERARREREQTQGGLSGFLHSLSIGLGIPTMVITIVLLVLLLLVVLGIAFFLYKTFRPALIVVSDNLMGKTETFEKRLSYGGSVRFNTPDGKLPSLGDENHAVFRLRKTFRGIEIFIEDEEAVAENSSYRGKGAHKLTKHIIELANGNRIRIAVIKK
jgi:hypothetical protein